MLLRLWSFRPLKEPILREIVVAPLFDDASFFKAGESKSEAEVAIHPTVETEISDSTSPLPQSQHRPSTASKDSKCSRTLWTRARIRSPWTE